MFSHPPVKSIIRWKLRNIQYSTTTGPEILTQVNICRWPHHPWPRPPPDALSMITDTCSPCTNLSLLTLVGDLPFTIAYFAFHIAALLGGWLLWSGFWPGLRHSGLVLSALPLQLTFSALDRRLADVLHSYLIPTDTHFKSVFQFRSASWASYILTGSRPSTHAGVAVWDETFSVLPCSSIYSLTLSQSCNFNLSVLGGIEFPRLSEECNWIVLM